MSTQTNVVPISHKSITEINTDLYNFKYSTVMFIAKLMDMVNTATMQGDLTKAKITDDILQMALQELKIPTVKFDGNNN